MLRLQCLSKPSHTTHWTPLPTDPNNCLSDKLIHDTTLALVNNGFRDAGYRIVWIDDCWANKARDAKGNLVPDPSRWPNGMKAVADFVHR